MFSIETLSNAITWVVFAVVGYHLSARIPPPRRPRAWVAWVVGLVLAGYIGISTKLISVFGFAAYLNTVLQGLVGGLFIGFLIRKEQGRGSQ